MKNLLKIVAKYNQLTHSVLNYDKFNRYSIVHHSTVIEGSTLSEEENSLLLDENLSPKNKPMQEVNMSLSHFQALKFILNIAEKKEKLSVPIIQKMAGMVVNYKYGNNPISAMVGNYYPSKGEFRKSGIMVGNNIFMDYKKVPGKVESLITHINDNIDKAKNFKMINDLAFDAHFSIVNIHPFADGNGRTSRLLMNYIQHYHNSPLTVVLKENKSDYYAALTKTRKTEDITVFRDFMYQQCEKQLLKDINLLAKPKINHKKDKGLSFLF